MVYIRYIDTDLAKINLKSALFARVKRQPKLAAVLGHLAQPPPKRCRRFGAPACRGRRIDFTGVHLARAPSKREPNRYQLEEPTSSHGLDQPD